MTSNLMLEEHVIEEIDILWLIRFHQKKKNVKLLFGMFDRKWQSKVLILWFTIFYISSYACQKLK